MAIHAVRCLLETIAGPSIGGSYPRYRFRYFGGISPFDIRVGVLPCRRLVSGRLGEVMKEGCSLPYIITAVTITATTITALY